MPGPVALQAEGDGWMVVCRLCDFVSEVHADCDTADDLTYEHVVQAHPEIEEP